MNYYKLYCICGADPDQSSSLEGRDPTDLPFADVGRHLHPLLQHFLRHTVQRAAVGGQQRQPPPDRGRQDISRHLDRKPGNGST